MPPLGLHMSLALRLGSELALRDLGEHEGEYLLGSTAPDIRVLTKWDRKLTHFFDIDDHGEQHAIHGLFAAQPQVADARLLDEPTRAFMAGYLTHLEMDESWILDIYRPYFGKNSPLGGDSRANVLDRILQYELERSTREDRDFVHACAQSLEKAVLDIECGFLDRETLLRWRELNLEIAVRPPDWDRFRHTASRHLMAAGIETVEAIDAFMAEVPDLLNETRRHVSPERVEQFLCDAHERSRATVMEYLQ
jgi:hypothetical protein